MMRMGKTKIERMKIGKPKNGKTMMGKKKARLTIPLL
jgi:hypothetical protein